MKDIYLYDQPEKDGHGGRKKKDTIYLYIMYKENIPAENELAIFPSSSLAVLIAGANVWRVAPAYGSAQIPLPVWPCVHWHTHIADSRKRKKLFG